MTIKAERFKSLDNQTLIGVADFISAKSSDIYNSVNTAAKEITDDVRSFFENTLQVTTVKPSVIIDKTVRAGKDAMGAVRDIGGFSDKDINKLVESLIPDNPAARSLFTKLGPKCSSKGLSSGAIGKPFDTSVDCGGKKRKGKRNGCNSSEYANVLNKLTDGEYSATYKDVNGALQNLVSLSKFGYDVNLCGVFSALTGDLDSKVLSRAGGALLGYLGGNGNTFGLMDLANSTAGLHILKEIPGGITTAFTNFKFPTDVLGRDIYSLAQRYTGAMQLLDDNWDKSKHDGMESISLTGKYNEHVDALLKAQRLNVRLDTSNLDAIPTDSSTFTSAAYSLGKLAVA
jgi:hypothetical protein